MNIRKNVYMTAFIVVTMLCVVLFQLSVAFKAKSVNIQENSNVDYTVYLKENNYFTEKYLPAGRQYIASLIDYIETKFEYKFQADKELDYTFSYDITGTLVAHEKDDESKVLYEKEYLLKEKEEDTSSHSDDFTIYATTNIDYDQYNEIISNFKKDFAISLDSYLKVQLNVEIKANYEEFDEPIIKKETLDVKIPLTEQTIKVGIEQKEVNQNTTEEQGAKGFEIQDGMLFGSFLLCIVADVILFILFIQVVRKENKSKSTYLKELEKIEKHYDRAIVETSTLPSEEGKEVIVVSTFEELLDARENIEKPILHVKEKVKSTFIIVDGDIIYKYILK